MNQVPRNDEGGKVDAANCLSIFTYLNHLLCYFKKHRYLQEDEFYATELYVLMNYNEQEDEDMYQEDEVSFNSPFDHTLIDLNNNTFFVSGEYEEVNMFVDVEHNEKDEEDDEVEGKYDETGEKSDENEENDSDHDTDDNEVRMSLVLMMIDECINLLIVVHVFFSYWTNMVVVKNNSKEGLRGPSSTCSTSPLTARPFWSLPPPQLAPLSPHPPSRRWTPITLVVDTEIQSKEEKSFTWVATDATKVKSICEKICKDRFKELLADKRDKEKREAGGWP
ncbi:PREDICTED: uncharacterized protein LOC108661604 [Theobroma cacao]|uniref:Uncharacterized protein LOC108661604 n=1 Tax=Theobroma cacao TaxID=3641 RepID=A0AB32W4Y2_THECC|nr:PREDICTED: uncharacterized protein LOC108661604 [Theobroma cacao]